MLRGLTSAGLGSIENDEQLIEIAGLHGFQAVDLDAAGLIERQGLEQARSLLAANGIVVGSIGLPVEWRTTEEQFLADLEHLAASAAAASALGCTSCCTYILPSTDQKAAHFMAVATRRLRICAQILHAYGIRLGLEFVGPYHLRTRWKNPFIWTLEETLDWIDTIGEPNVGLLLDSYHWYTNGLSGTHIEALRADQIVHVHINDAPNVPLEEVLDNGRIYPGEGVIDLVSFLQALHTIGYKGAVSQEILVAEAPTQSTEELALRSKSGFDMVFSEAGL